MIKYNNNTINDWNFGDDNIIKVYKHGAVCYYKITSGDTPTPVQEPCFAVVDNITLYSDTEFEDVFNKADGKWYKLNNLNQYEQYGVYGSGRTITTYEGKLTIDGDYEYQYSGGSWVNVGEVSGGTIETVWLDYPSNNNVNAKFNIGHYWGENYKMVCRAYISGSYSSDRGSFWIYDTHTPIEFNFYSNGFYYDFHNPTSTTSPDVNTGDYSWRIMKNGSLSSYENSQILDFTLTNGTVEVKLEETGVAVVTGSTSVTAQNWYNGLYQASIGIMNNYNRCHLSSIKIYNGNDELVNDLKFVKNQGVTGSQELSLYDSVLNVTYNNTNSYTPVYHVVEESGGTTYPIYYDEIQDPPNNLSFSSMTEAEEYECPYVGMKATINGDKYIFSGDSQSGYEWVYNPSRLPDGYTEVEYVERNSAHKGYLPLGEYFQANTRIQIDFQMTQAKGNAIIGDYGSNDNDDWRVFLNYDSQVNNWLIYDFTNSRKYYNTGDWSKRFNIEIGNYYIKDLDSGNYLINTTAKTSFSRPNQMYLFHMDGTQNTNNIDYGYIYSVKIYQNNELVRDFVPCIRDNDSKVGMYDLVNDVFYYPPNNGTLVAGDPV